KNIQTVAGVYGGYIHSSGNIDSAADMNSNRVFSNYIQSNGRVVAGEYVQINGQAQTGRGCSPNGLQGRTAEGAILSCVNGVWTGGSKVNRNQCMWLSAPNAFSCFGKRAWELHEKPVICPDNYIMVGTKMWGWAEGVDDEHVDAYCCPLS
ncbi:shufflon system plasmid conjugative transfer pilus tip adhesin PilV, partial [Salmonella enterica]|nr:shufflon system plasmid conjugative transfer pilus tip adhesin PilV [Salmonella enterica]MDJ7335553.1 shufflon system plasmid conjugative transfer pilus tip adhesin PilV [Salmonella enterica]